MTRPEATAKVSQARVFLIEDSQSDAYLVRLALERTSLRPEITHFADSEAALESLAALGVEAAPDLLILDLNIPRKDGFEVLEALRGMPRMAHLPVLVLTSSISPEDKRRAAKAGVRKYVSKPMLLDDFLRDVGSSVEQTIHEARAASE